MGKQNLQDIISRVKEIPVVLESTQRILKLMERKDSHILKISESIQTDFGLTLRLLKMANSSDASKEREIVTVLEALVLLGMDTVKELVMAASAYPILNKKVSGYLLDQGDLWRHSLCCAAACELIAREVNASPDKAYMAGLLHDVGKLVLAHYAEDKFLDIIHQVEKNHVPFDEAEQQVLGFSHAELGAEVLRMWGQPRDIVKAVQFHHHPQLSENNLLGGIVHLGDIASLMLGMGVGIDGLHYALQDSAFTSIGLKKENWECILDKTSSIKFNQILTA